MKANNSALTPINKQRNLADPLSLPVQPEYPQPPAYNQNTGFADYWRVLTRYKKSIMLITLLLLCMVALLTYSLVPQYEARGSIKLDTSPTQILDWGLGAQNKQQQDGIVLFQTEYKVLRSRKLASRVINELQLTDSLLNQHRFKPFVYEFLNPLTSLISGVLNRPAAPPKDQSLTAIDIFLKNLTISPVKDSQVIEIKYKDNTAEKSAKVVNTFIASYIAHRGEEKKDTARRIEDFLRQELAEARSKLRDAEKDLLDYSKKKKIINTGSERPIDLKTLEDLSAAYIKAKEQRIIAQSDYDKRRNPAANVNAIGNELIQRLKARLSELNTQYQEESKIYKPNYPGMISLRAQINHLNHQIQSETKSVVSSVGNNLKGLYLSAVEQEKKLESEIQKLRNKLLAYEDKNVQYVTLQREVETNRAMYDGLLQRFKEVSVVGSFAEDAISIIDPAQPPALKSSPKTTLNLLAGGLLGFFIGALSAFVRSHFNNKIKTLDDLEALQLPYKVLTSLPTVKGKDKKILPFLAAEKPTSSMAESIRYLYTNLAYYSGYGSVPKLIHLTSSVSGEGKSSTVINLASLLSRSGRKVLIIDADLRKPTMHDHLKVDNYIGLSNYLAGKIEELPIAKTSHQNPLYVIPAGPAVPDPVHLLSNQRMIDLCEIVRDTYDYVIIDSPPVLGMADALVLSNRADATAFVVSSDRPTSEELQHSLKNLERGFANIVGLIFTKSGVITNRYYSQSHYSDGRKLLT